MSTPRRASWCTWTSRNWAASGRSENASAKTASSETATPAGKRPRRHRRPLPPRPGRAATERARSRLRRLHRRSDPPYLAARPSNASSPTTAAATAQAPSPPSCANTASATSAPAPTAHAPTAKPKPSSASSNANGPTPIYPQRHRAQALPGWTGGTTTTDHTAHSTATHPSPASHTPSCRLRRGYRGASSPPHTRRPRRCPRPLRGWPCRCDGAWPVAGRDQRSSRSLERRRAGRHAPSGQTRPGRGRASAPGECRGRRCGWPFGPDAAPRDPMRAASRGRPSRVRI